MKEEKPIINNIFNIKDENGKSVECEILFTFDSPETKKNYIIYTDHTKDETGAIKVYANVFNPSGVSRELMPIETEEEWNTIESIMAKLNEKEAGK